MITRLLATICAVAVVVAPSAYLLAYVQHTMTGVLP